MKTITLQKINNGDSGSVAAGKIFGNDKKLANAVEALRDYLESYGELIQITTSGGTISIETEPGYSETGVMTQKATTEFVYDKVDGMCKIGETIEGSIQIPSSSEYVNVWVSRASSNAQGHSLTVLYNDVEELKEIIINMQSEINSLKERVSTLEGQNT